MGAKKPKIVVLGSYNQDLIMYTPEIPRLKETVKRGQFQMFSGGKGANQAHAAAMAGGEVTLIAKVGKDAFGTAAIEHFKKAGIKTDYVYQDSTVATGCAMIMVEKESGENLIVVASGANEKISPAEIDKAQKAIKEADFCLCQFENNLDAITRFVELAAQANKPVCINPAPAIKPFPKELLKYATILAPNEIEIESIVGYTLITTETAKRAAQELIALGPRVGIITMGNLGAVGAIGQETIHIPAFKVKVVDTTGAGDAFMGGFAVAWAEKPYLQSALRFASATAALKCTKKGAAAANPTRAEIDQLLLMQK